MSRIRSGDFLGAAQEYARLAATATPQSARYSALAAIAYVDAGDSDSARAILQSEPGGTSAIYELAKASAEDLSGGTDAAAAALGNASYNSLTPYQRNVYKRTEGRIELARGNFGAAAAAFVAADAYPLPAEARAELHKDTWLALSRMDDTDLAAGMANAQGREAGWYALAISARATLHDSAALATSVENWRASHPDHPANASLIEYLYEVSESLAAQARHIALLLPFSGHYANAANAIKDGFLSAWYAAAGSSGRPIVSVYNADAETIVAVYDTAVANGADFIVGPLEKPAVEALMQRQELPVRTMALNSGAITGTAATANETGFFQFGLTPENEAASVADKAWSDGHTRVVAMTPQTNWGRRVSGAFAQRWENLGGTILSEVTFGGEDTTYAGAVKQALNIDLSEARAAELRRALGRTIHFEPRRRADVDAIVLAGFPVSARQLLPQFRYFRAESVPMYATSHAYSGRNNPGLDQDLDGLRFGDMPWLFGTSDSANRDMFRRNWPDTAAGSGRLFAFGLDAYRILPYLFRMRHQPGLRIPGSTGVLHMDSKGHVVRDLAWAQFASGIPVPLRE